MLASFVASKFALILAAYPGYRRYGSGNKVAARPSRLKSWWRRMRPAGLVDWLTILSLSVGVGMLVFGGAILFDMKNDARKQVEQSSNNLATALARDIARNLKVYDLSVQGAIDAWDRWDIQQISAETRRMALFDSAVAADYLGSLSIVDPSGTIVASSAGAALLNINVADRDYFRMQQERVDAGLYLSRPFSSRVRNGDLTIAISRRIFRHDGQFGGIAMGTVRVAFFQQLFDKLDLGQNGTVTLLRTDGRLIAHTPFKDAVVDQDYSRTAVFRHFLTAPAGHLVDEAPVDGVESLVTYQQIADLPLVLSVAVSTSDVYAQWWRKAVVIGIAQFLLCGAITVLLILFRREILHRIAAEQQLAVLANTDGLTGMANRRSWEQQLASEWRRAIRAELPIAILMLDVDFFKAFNDTYGHPAGDQILRTIADTIVRNIRRPCDLAGRYGGEEFVALLPEVEASGASVVAARVCAAVAELRIPHAGSPMGHVTVSIGVAATWPMLGGPEAVLVKTADEALYEAKQTGRNRVCGGSILSIASGTIVEPLRHNARSMRPTHNAQSLDLARRTLPGEVDTDQSKPAPIVR